MGRITLTEEQKRIAESIRSGQGASTQQAPSAYRGGRITLNQKQIQIASKYGLPNPDYGKNAQSTQTTVDDPLHKQYAAFMAYQNAVREAELAQIEPGAALKGRASGQKKTENAGAETDGKVSEQEYGRSSAMQTQYGTYQNYLRGVEAAQGLKLGTLALQGQSALLAGRFAPATQQVRGDVDAQNRRAKAAQTAQRDQVRGMRRTSQELDKQIEALEIEQADTHFSGTGLSENGKSVTQLQNEIDALKERKAQVDSQSVLARAQEAIGNLSEEDQNLLRQYRGKELNGYQVRAYAKYDAKTALNEKGYSDDTLKRLAEWQKVLDDYDNAQKLDQAAQEMGSGSFAGKAAATLFSAALAPGKALGNVESLRGVLPKWAGGYQNEDMPTNVYSPAYNASRLSSGIRQSVMQNMNPTGQFLYQAGTSALDSAVNMAVSTGLVGTFGGVAGAGAKDAVAETMNWVMGSQVAADSVYEGIQNGKSNADALVDGIVEGAIEGFTEKYSVGDIIENMLSGKAVWRKALRSFASEGAEEIASNWLNRAYDVVAKHDRGEVMSAYANYIAEGRTPAQALAAMVGDFAKEDSLSFLAGGLSGLAMSGTYAGVNRVILEANVTQTARAVIEAGEVQDVIDYGMAQEEGTKAHQLAEELQQTVDDGGEVTQKAVENTLREVAKEQQAAVDEGQEPRVPETLTRLEQLQEQARQEQAQAEAQERTFQRFREATEEGERNQAVFREATQGRYETGNADPYAERGTQFDVSDERSAVYAAEEAGEISHAEAEAALNTLDSDEAVNRVEAAHVEAEKTRQDARDKKDAATAVERLRTQQEQADAELRRAEAKRDRAALAKAAVQYGLPQTLGNALPEHYAEYRNKNLGPLSAAEYADAVHAAYQAGRNGLNLNAGQKAAQSVQREVAEQAWNAGKGNNGTAKQNAPDDSSKRDASMDTGRSGGAVAESAGQTAKGQSERSRLAERIELENRVRAAKQPYLSGQDIGVEKGAAEKSLQEVPKKFWTKSIDQADAELRKAGYEDIHFFIGKIGVVNQKAQVVRYANGMRTGSSVWVCANDKAFTVEQIARHEAFHKMAEDVPGVLEAVRAQIASELGDEGLQALALRYAEAYEGCYGEDEIDRYIGEVCADAYAGIERFGEASKQAADAVWQTRGTETGTEKPASPRGPPEEYSIANTRKMPWKEQVQGYFKNDKTIKSSDSLYLGESDVSGVANSPLYVPTSVITKAIRPPKGSRSAHSLTQADILKLESGIKNAAAVIVNPERNAIVYLTGNRDSAGNYVIAAFDMNNDLFGENAHKATSIHGRENIAAMLEKLGDGATIFVKNEDKLNQMLPGNQILKSLELLAKVELDEQSIAEQRENVNTDFSIETQAETDNATAEQETETRNLTMDTIPKKAQNYLNGAARNLAAALQRQTRLPFADHSEEIRDSLKPLMNEYLQTGDIQPTTIDKSFNEAYAKGVELEKELYEKTKTLAQELRQTPITLNEKERAALRGYDVFKKTTKGRLYVVNEGGRSVNAVYQEMSRAMPEVFPRGAKGTEEQILTLLAGSHRLDLAKSNAEGAAGRYAEEYKQTAKQDYENGVRDMMGDLRVARRYAEAQARRMEPFVAPKSYDEVQELYSQQNEQRRAYERVDRQYLLTAEDRKVVNRLLRGDITPEKVTGMENAEGILAVYEAKADYDLTTLKIQEWRKSVKAERMETARKTLGNISEAKDKKAGIWYKRETQERNARDIFKADTAERIIDHYFRPVHHAAAEETRLKNRMKGQIEALGLKRHAVRGDRVSESAAVQILGEAQDNIRVLEASRGRLKAREGRTLQEWDAVVQELWKTSPHLDKTRIENAVQEFRGIYDELFQMMNEVRVRNGYAPINYRSGYFPHFQVGASDGILNLMGAAMGIDAGIEVLPTDVKGVVQWILQQKKNGKQEQGSDALPTTINGRTGGFKPGITWFANSLERTGFQTAYDAVKGFDKYIEGAAKVIFYTDSIQNLRALATETRYLTGDDGLRERIDAVRADESLNEAQKDVSVEDIQKNGRYSLSRWAANLDEYTNLLAGKKSELDRPIEQMTSRDMYRLLNKWQGRVAANMVAVNPASWLTNFGVIQQAAAQLNEDSLMKARAQAAANTFRNDGFEERSDFLTSRRGSSMLVNGWVDNASAALSKPMEVIDMYSANVIVRARYMDNLRRGMSEEFAMQEADEFAAGVMADRSKGAQPTLFESRNPLTKMFTQFQLEVNNTFSYLFKDLPREQRKRGVAAVAFAMFMYLLRNWFFNEGYEKMIGRRPMFDPFNMITETVGNYTGYTVNNMWDAIDGTEDGIVTKKEAKGAGAATWDTMVRIGQEIPGIGSLLGGGRLPFASTMPDVENILNLLDKDIPGDKKWPKVAEALKAPAVYWLPPFGGGQAKKIYEGSKAVVNKGSYKLNGDGEEQLQYPVYTDRKGDLIRAWTSNILFGKSSTKAARDWVESGFQSLSAKETAAYQGMTESGTDQRESYAFVTAMKKVDDKNAKLAMLYAYDIPQNAKTAYYYSVMASDEEQAKMDALAADGVSYDAYMQYKQTYFKQFGTQTVSQERIQTVLDGMNLTKAQKAALWAAMGTSWKEENNPYK